MKRKPQTNDAAWNAELEARKLIAESRMKDADRTFFKESVIFAAAMKWYGRHDIDAQCLAENRLARGEVP